MRADWSVPQSQEARQVELSKPVGPTFKAPGQRDRILSFLRQRGEVGACGSELIEMGHRFGGRLFELRKLGYQISTVRVSEGEYRYILLSEPTAPHPLPNFQPRSQADQSLPLFVGLSR